MLPMIGVDWTQPGIAPLFANIRRNGYYILYLTTRAIGQVSPYMELEYLKYFRLASPENSLIQYIKTRQNYLKAL